jgi:hypothetical protein
MFTRRRSILAAALVSAASIVFVSSSQSSQVHASGRAPLAGAHPDDSATMSNCKVGKADFITNQAGPFGTSSSTFSIVPGMSKTIKVGGKAPGCVLVSVSGAAYAPDGEAEWVGVTLDGNRADPSDLDFAENDLAGAASAHAALFAFPSVAPGNHTVAMVFLSAYGGTVFITSPAMRIDHP